MARKGNLELRQKIWHKYVNDPDQLKIARELEVSPQLVSYHVTKLKGQINYRLNRIAIEEFQETRIKVIDAVQDEIAEVTEEIRQQDDPFLKLKLREYRQQLRIDLYKLQGDGESVLALKKKMMDNERVSNRLTKNQ